MARQEIKECEARIEAEQNATNATKDGVEGLQKEIAELEKEMGDLTKKVEEFRQKAKRRKPTKLTLTVNYTGPSTSPPDTRRMALNSRVAKPNLIWYLGRLHFKRPCLKHLKTCLILSPLYFNWLAQ